MTTQTGGRRSTRAVQADRRRQELLAVALRLFAERGFQATTIADIASATGTAHGLVYHYFRSKDEMLRTILEQHSFLPELRRLLAVSPDRPATDVLREVATSFSAMLGARSDLLRLVSRESASNPVVAQALAGVMREGTELLGAYLEARIAAGELRSHDPTVPARALFWAIITRHISGAPADGFETDLIDVLLQGIATR